MAIVGTGGKYGFVNTEGVEAVPLIYDKVYNFNEGFAWVVLNDKYSFIDKTGKEILPLS